ncbi:MAG: hypothetical protein OEL57_07145 [Trichlorobacter sp.]|uniref:hypothetical protein n=1 Tax=Trichlorobacter sp. TaxID=2911007 RepID=UPI002568CA16|nr:hypothetical protein [Trichlorobacter sp.]MDK9717670.1 hypothetical protein [Trichlorobacter sp.]
MKSVIASVIASCLITAPAWAATPLLTDDANTLGTGKGQFEICGRVGFDRDLTDGIATKSTTSQITSAFTYGVADPVDLVLEFARTWGTSSTVGVDSSEPDAVDFKISSKIKVYEVGGYTFALRPDLGYSYMPSGNAKDYAPFWGGVLIVGKQFEPVSFNVNLGYLHYNYQSEADREGLRPDIWSASISAAWQATKDLQVVADIGTGTNLDKTTSEMPVFSCAGLIYSLTEYLDIAAGAKFGLNKPETDITLQSALVLKF